MCLSVGNPREVSFPGDFLIIRKNDPVILAGLLRGFRELRGHKILVGHALVQFSCFLQNILQKLKAVFFKDRVILSGILVLVTANNDSDFVHRGLLELGSNGFGYFLGGVGVDVVHAFLDGIRELLD